MTEMGASDGWLTKHVGGCRLYGCSCRGSVALTEQGLLKGTLEVNEVERVSACSYRKGMIKFNAILL